jgi:hypothetical protein
MYNIPICINYQGMLLSGNAYPVQAFGNNKHSSLQVFILGWYLGILTYKGGKWTMDQPIDTGFIKALGKYIQASRKLTGTLVLSR